MNNCENRDKCLKYAQAYIIPQKFKNLYSLNSLINIFDNISSYFYHFISFSLILNKVFIKK